MKNYKLSIDKRYIVYFIKILYILFFIMLYYNNYITNDRIYSFLLILCLILCYTRILRYVKKNETQNFVNKYNIEKYLIFSKYKNIILYLVAFFEINLYNSILWLNNVLYSKQYIVFILYKLITQLLIKPIKLLFYFYYKIIIRWSSISILELMFRRIEGLIFSVLIFSNLYLFILNQIKGFEFLFLYIILIILNLIIEYYNGEIKILKKKFNINYDFNSLLWLRYQVSILNILILKCIKKENIKVNKRFINLIHYWFIEDDFAGSINSFKLEAVHNWNLIKLDFKNQPTLVLYNWLHKIYETNLLFSNLLDNKYYISRHKDLKMLKLIKSIYQCDEIKIKLLIYLLWDIEDYYGVDNIDHYKSHINMDLACLNITNIFNDFKYLSTTRITNKIKYNSFYDLELNYEFFNQLYLILNKNKSYQKNMNLIEFTLNEGFDRTLDCYNNIDNEDSLVIWISEFLNNLRKDWLLLNMAQKEKLYFNLIKLLNDENKLSEKLFEESWLLVYIKEKNTKRVIKVNNNIIALVNKLEAEHSLIENKKSRIRKFLEYLFYSL